MSDNIYAEAARIWVSRHHNIPVERIKSVDFAVERGGGCSTCAYEDCGLEIRYTNGRYDTLGLWVTPGEFIQECVEIVNELKKEADGSTDQGGGS